jgi:UDP-GlcNAc:undecaprenyl-phosphate GlcNAc-1-phosphate transferase
MSFDLVDLAPPMLVALVAFAGTGIARARAIRTGRLDAPDPTRRIHERPTPRNGGLGVAAGFLPALVALLTFDIEASEPWRLVSTVAVGAGAAAFLGVGLLDDRRSLPAWAKAVLQVAAALIAVALGLRFQGVTVRPEPAEWSSPFAWPTTTWPELGFGAWWAPATVLWILAVVNVVNFLDGIDGIVSVTAVVALGASVVYPHSAEPVFLLAAGAIAGFAAWNLPRARCFLGDGGSHLVGFLVAALPCAVPRDLAWTLGYVSTQALFQEPPWGRATPWPLVAAALLPAVLDVVEALVHKARVGVPMSQAHADHLYQRLVKAGRPAWAVALRYGLLSLAGVLLAGPVAARWGLAAALVPGALLLVVHWVTGVRATRHVPRLARP